jgi:cellulose synthase/poly-beta-1,6-N-acetylglucosamine synthase-like glycosyltransferase
MQKNGYKIANSHSAFVYTIGPAKLKGLFKQRVRWSYGFLNNALDYRDMYFNKKYGHIGVYILPMATFSIFSTLYAAGNFIWSMASKIPDQVLKYQAVGFNPHMPSLGINWFAFNTGTMFWLASTAVALSLVLLFFSLKITEGRARLSKDVFYYLALYIFLPPLWLAKATYSTLLRKDIAWK